MKIDINLKRDSNGISSLIPGSAQISSVMKSISDHQLPSLWTKTTQKVIKVGALVMVVIVVGALIRHCMNRFQCCQSK
jgi:uncharacterized membrane protein YjjB (DUF3815 family)